MSDETQEMPQATKPVAEHKWLESLLGEWSVESEMSMGPDQPTITGAGTESVRSLGGLFSVAEGTSQMPDGNAMKSYQVLGYDVSFREYRGVFYCDASSHLWRYVGTLSEDGRTMTLDCEGPDMVEDGKTARYRDVIELIDENTRTMTSSGQDGEGNWVQFMKVTYRRVR